MMMQDMKALVAQLNEYAYQYLKLDIKYFSLLRCLSEFQIAMLFANYKQYHKVFKSCNIPAIPNKGYIFDTKFEKQTNNK